MRLLIVEDSERLSEYLASALRREGFAADVVNSVADADAATATTVFDAIILDLGLPDADGLDWLPTVRAKNDHTPVLILTARDGTKSVVSGLNAGADDYLKKPFDVQELVARLRALLRRPGHALGSQLSQGNLTFDTSSREVAIAGNLVELGRRESAVLELLLRRNGRVVSKSAIEEATYGYGEELSSNAIEVLIHRLRKRIGDGGANVYIHTLRGVGYVLSSTPVG